MQIHLREIIIGIIIIVLLVFGWIFALNIIPPEEMETVEYIDAESYSGQWYSVYEIPVYYGFYPFGFDSTKCEDSQAYYEVMDNGNIKVKNSCMYESENRIVEGEAWFAESEPNGKLWVSFNPLFKSPYYIIGIDENYNWSIVGTPDRDSLWFLSRSSSLTNDDYNEMVLISENHGFNCEKLTEVKR